MENENKKTEFALSDPDLLYREYWMEDEPYQRYSDFKQRILGLDDDVPPGERYTFIKRTRLVILLGTLICLVTNFIYFIKYFVDGTNVPIDVAGLATMFITSLLVFIYALLNKRYESKTVRVVQDVYYLLTGVAVTMLIVAANIEKNPMSISMCYLFIFFVAPPFDLVDTIFAGGLVFLSGLLPAFLPGKETFPLIQHLIIRFAIIIGMFFVRDFLRKQAKDESRLLSLNNVFVKLAYVDIMTSSINSKGLQAYKSYLEDNFEGSPCGILMYDIDNFKSYNDSYSHMAGDRCLARASKAAIRAIKKYDTYLFRYGGEEFVVVRPNVTEEEMVEMGLDILKAIRDENISRDDIDGVDRVSVSIGVSVSMLEKEIAYEPMKKSDDQLYIGKNNGKNCVVAGGKIYRLE
ncbi:MAG: GGDEF domain-containing protein [Bacilli bacterium]|nr:GGDEF domain-containing protein [Bacilli bacterium]